MRRARLRVGVRAAVLAVSASGAAAFGTTGCGTAAQVGGAAATPDPRPPVAHVRLLETTAEDPPTAFVTGSELVGHKQHKETRLSHMAAPSLFGWTSPLAVPSANGQQVVYSAWKNLVSVDPEKSFSQQNIKDGDALGRPSIRMVDTDTGTDSLIEDGAFSVAWRSDGALAYSKGEEADFRADVPYMTDIVVRQSVDAKPETWTTTPGRYIVVAWARHTLLAYDMQEGEQLDLIALDGPGSARQLASDTSLVAVSPDGTRAVVSGADGAAARLLDVASGTEVARVDAEPPAADPSASTASPASEPAVQGLLYGGSWTGDHVVAESPGGLVLLHATASGLSVERTLAMPTDALPLGVHEPQFADTTGTRVTAWAPVKGGGGRAVGYENVYLDCEIADATCSVGPPRNDRIFSQAYNPSRPEGHR